jgi:DNA-directed RNA polymerase specialized sigma24 family protein
MWRAAVGIGLSEHDAAQVCELAWLRLGQRLHTFASRTEVAGWLEETVRRESAAVAAQRVRTERQAAHSNVVRLAPGFAPTPRAASTTQTDRAGAHAPAPRQQRDPADVEAADLSVLPG